MFVSIFSRWDRYMLHRRRSKDCNFLSHHYKCTKIFFFWSSYLKVMYVYKYFIFLLLCTFVFDILTTWHLLCQLLLLFLLFLLSVIMATTTKVVNFGYIETILRCFYDLSGCNWRLCIQVLSNDNKTVFAAS